jgi:hypothetical protein
MCSKLHCQPHRVELCGAASRHSWGLLIAVKPVVHTVSNMEPIQATCTVAQPEGPLPRVSVLLVLQFTSPPEMEPSHPT